MFDLHNESGMLRPIGGPWSCFQRLRLHCGGQLVEDIDKYAAVHEMFSILGAEGTIQNDYAEGLSNLLGKIIKDIDSMRTSFLHRYSANTTNDSTIQTVIRNYPTT